MLSTHIDDIFPGITVSGAHQFRVTRNSELFINEEEVTDLADAVKGELSYRQYGDAVRLETSISCPTSVTEYLLSELGLTERDLFPVNGPVNLVRLNSLPDLLNRQELEFIKFTPGLPNELPKHIDIFGIPS